MKLKQVQKVRGLLLLALIISLTALSSTIKADTGTCGGVTITLPFNDVMASPFFCQIASAYYSGLTNGTTATTYSPTQTVTREQMAAFISRTLDQSLKRGSKKAVAKKWFTPQTAANLTLTTVGAVPQLVEFDGIDLWVASLGSGTVTRVRPGDGTVLSSWTGAAGANGIVCALGKVFITGQGNPGKLYMIDPTQAPGTVTTLTSSLGGGPFAIAFDGTRLWTANANSVSIVSLNPTTVITVSTGFILPIGVLYDGSNIWVTDQGDDSIKKLDSSGAILQSITVGSDPDFPVFDGTNIWVPNSGSPSVSVVRVKDATGNALASPFVLATLTGNGLNTPFTAAFDGERILITNFNGNSVSLWKAADLTPLGTFPTGASTAPFGACSDGLNFWITLQNADKLARF
jgi:DNA-binding beta-propeller fold protein YncE